MKLATVINILGVLATASAAPSIPSGGCLRASGDGTVNVTRFPCSLDDAKLELVDESSHFSVSKRVIWPIEHLDNPADGKSVDHERDDNPVVVGRDSQKTGVGKCGQVNCPTTSVGLCGKVNCPP